MQSILIAPPAAEPVTLAEARAWLRLDANDEDAAIASLVAAARVLVETATRRALVTQTWRLVLDAWPDFSARAIGGTCEIVVPLAPVQSVAGVRVYNAAGAQQLDAAAWRLFGAPEQARIVLSPPPQSGPPADGMEIDLVAGYGDPQDTPAPLRHAILALTAFWFDNRGDVGAAGPENLPLRVAALIAPFRRRRLA
ncbi:MAG: phage head-tail connector protein [Rhodoblastus sp.]